MTERLASAEMRPGMKLRSLKYGDIVTLGHRKKPEDRTPGVPFHTGWWLVGDGGLADFVIDAPNADWVPVEP